MNRVCGWESPPGVAYAVLALDLEQRKAKLGARRGYVGQQLIPLQSPAGMRRPGYDVPSFFATFPPITNVSSGTVMLSQQSA